MAPASSPHLVGRESSLKNSFGSPSSAVSFASWEGQMGGSKDDNEETEVCGRFID